MAKYKIYSVTGGHVPPYERIEVTSLNETAPNVGIGDVVSREPGEGYVPGYNSDPNIAKYVVMSNPLTEYVKEGKALVETYAVYASPDIVFEDENGNKVRLA